MLDHSNNKNNLYPIYLKLDKLKILLVGAGNVGEEKLTSLLTNAPEACIHIVAPEAKAAVVDLLQNYPNCSFSKRPFEIGDLLHQHLVICATDNKNLHAQIKLIANEKGILVNVADTPTLCDFYLSSIVQKGNLKIAISTNGQSPTAAKRLKEVLQEALPNELDEVLTNLNGIRNKLSGDFAYKVKKMQAITATLVQDEQSMAEKRWRKIASFSVLIFASMLIGHFLFSYFPFNTIWNDSVALYKNLDPNFHWMLLAGFLAQLVDGALGMGYGVTSATILLSIGVNPAAISGSIHTAEMFASGASGYSHYKFGNVNKKLFKALLIPGVIGAIAGAILLTQLGNKNADYIRPIMAAYTFLLGIRILLNAFRKEQVQKKFKHYGWLAGAGGFLDSFGGGGWGPIVTTTLITKGRSPKYVIGSVSLTEFFVTLASAFTFFTILGISHWQTIVALIIGGFTAAPFAAKLAGRLPKKISFILLGILVIIWSLRILIKIL